MLYYVWLVNLWQVELPSTAAFVLGVASFPVTDKCSDTSYIVDRNVCSQRKWVLQSQRQIFILGLLSSAFLKERSACAILLWVLFYEASCSFVVHFAYKASYLYRFIALCADWNFFSRCCCSPYFHLFYKTPLSSSILEQVIENKVQFCSRHTELNRCKICEWMSLTFSLKVFAADC